MARNTITAIAPAREELVWRVLCLLNLYRLLVPSILFGLHVLALEATEVGWTHPVLFLTVDLAYFALAILTIAALKMRRPPLQWQAWVHLTFDVLALSTILYSSGGVSSGLGILFVMPVAAVSLILHKSRGFVVAAFATLALLLQEVLTHLGGFGSPTDYTGAGVLGAILFMVALSARPLAERLQESEEQVRQKEIDLANLAELSHYIVQHLRESLLVVDPSDRIRLINESAAQILGERSAVRDALIGEVSPRLLYFLETWRQGPHAPPPMPTTFVSADGTRVIQPHFTALGQERPGPILIFLEDTSLLSERVQQSKLAALGRLSASIAHEIRNPVGAMSHAGQLLAESPNLTPQELRLTEIVRTNSERVSTIINNVLQLSRRDTTAPERLTLGDWLEEFRNEFCETTEAPRARFELNAREADIEVRVDPTHLHQVVWNLCENALRHTQGESLKIEINCGRVAATGRPYLEVADRGPGIDAQISDKIFEPFFTASDGGTGLGLFIARELCQCNGALLLYEPRTGGGSLFRVVFADPKRWAAHEFMPPSYPSAVG